MEKSIIYQLFIAISLILFLTSIVSANKITDALTSIEGNLNERFQSAGSSDTILLYISIFLFLFIVIYSILYKVKFFNEGKTTPAIIAFLIAIIAIRGLSYKQILLGILAPYNILGGFFIFIMPFLIFLFMIHALKFGGLGRKLSWIAYAIAMLLLFIKDYSNLTPLKIKFYIADLILIVTAFIFDTYIQRLFEPKK